MKFGVGFLLALLVGFEATLRRFAGAARLEERGIVVGDDVESAERRFFDAWVKDEAARRRRRRHPRRRSCVGRRRRRHHRPVPAAGSAR